MVVVFVLNWVVFGGFGGRVSVFFVLVEVGCVGVLVVAVLGWFWFAF